MIRLAKSHLNQSSLVLPTAHLRYLFLVFFSVPIVLLRLAITTVTNRSYSSHSTRLSFLSPRHPNARTVGGIIC